MDYIWSKVGEMDERITVEEPFKLVKTDPEKAKTMIRELLQELYVVGRMLNPIMPKTSDIIKESILANKKPDNLFSRLV